MPEVGDALRINVGCGTSPIPGWKNFDNSWSVRLRRIPFLPGLLSRLGLLEPSSLEFMEVARLHEVEFADIRRGLPIPGGAAEVFYASHVLEHLDRGEEVSVFLAEAQRVLRPGGVIRLVVPDLRRYAREYLAEGDANAFLEKTHLVDTSRGSASRRVRRWLVGQRHHLWMYDADSLCHLLREQGFRRVRSVAPGETRIPDPEPLDLSEREGDSIYVEAEAAP